MFDRLEELADQDANADAREIILTRLEELKNNPDIAQVIGQLKTPEPDQKELDEYSGTGAQREFKNGQWVPTTKQASPPVKETFDTDEVSPVESAIINRITMAHTDLLAKFGPEAVMNAARDQADFVGDVDEIGSSDVSGWVKNVIRDLESTIGEASDTVEKDPETGRVKSWKHDGDWKKIPKRNGKPVDPRGEVANMAGRELQRAKSLKEDDITEGAMKDWLWKEAERMDKDAFISNADEYGMTPEEAAEWWDSINGEVEESAGGGNWLEENGSIVDQMTKIQDEIEKINRSGGRVPLNDPLSRKLKMLKNKLHKSKGVNENTALTGPYGHSGKLEPVEGIDEDMMARIKFLAGIRETDTTTNGQEDSNLTAMKSVSSIFLR